MKKRIMLVLLTTLLVFTLVGPPVFAKDPDKGAQGVPFQELQDALDEAMSTLQRQIDEVVSDLDQLVGDIDSIVQGKVDVAIAALSINWSQITGVPADLTDGDDVGITSETDPTVLDSVKDGVDWSELSGIPAGFADDIDDVGMGSEIDPIFSASDASGITNGDVASWDTAYGWGDHSATGYLTGEADPTVLASVKDGIDWSELTNRPAGLDDGDDVGTGDGHSLDAADGDPVDAVYVDNAGNVGIGTTSPEEKLHVSGDIKTTRVITASTSDYDKLRLYGSPNYTIGFKSSMSVGYVNGWATTFTMDTIPDRGWVWRDTADPSNDGAMSLTTDGRLYVKSTAAFDGDVGIGTSSPAKELDVDGDVQANRYYDRDNTAYYVDPAFISIMNTIETEVSRAERFHDIDNLSYFVDPASTSYLNAVRASIYYDLDNLVYLVNPAGSSVMNVVEMNRARSNYFQDLDDFSYYVDPDSTSVLNRVNITVLMNLTPLSTAPTSPQEGDIYYDDTANKLKCWDGSTWQSLW